MAVRGHRRSRAKRKAPISSIERSIEHASTQSIVMSAIPMAAGGLLVPAVAQFAERRGWLNTSVKDADYRRYIYSGVGAAAGVAIHGRFPNAGLGLVVGSIVVALMPPLAKAVDQGIAQLDAPPAPPAPPAPGTP